ncbi:hypothetical protein A1O3_05359 [Capronia epimyces CBS 606.96]|uniref:Major facilitator superfamily (MFS) profile domain-containing protein n=1 Tax=Capronia epimyces CBS 606.96 TaxID=1182542 RepID=W9YQZ5_9EURO|nr:uncharacterized protein A1O3_05359 [Capronia epimyces CBS 606.96]EXJ84689.1 hypothetical protein A1O3_05359 [Capronia epimyces CBS 606.96]
MATLKEDQDNLNVEQDVEQDVEQNLKQNLKQDVEQDMEAPKHIPPPNMAGWKPCTQELMIMLTLAIISLMVSLDATVIITSLSTIVQALNATATQGFWIGTSYLLTCAVTMPFIASLSDMLGRPPCLFASLVAFTTGTVLCATAHSIALLLVGRCIQGVGGGGIIILSLVIFSDIVPLRFRPRYVGIIQGAWALGTCVGPIVGGGLATPTLWRWVFYIMFPLAGIGLVCVPLFVRLKPSSSWTDMVTRVDWLGGILFICSATAVLIAVSWGGTQEPWGSWRTVVPLAVGAVGLVATSLWECFGASHPFLRHSLFNHRSAVAVYMGAFAQGLLLYGQLYYIPFFFESAKLSSPLRTGVCLLPVMLTLIPASVLVGSVITRTARYRWAIWAGWTLTTLATGPTILWDVDTSPAVWVVILVMLGLGHGLLLNALNTASQAVSVAGHEGAAVAMYAFLRSFGMAVGVGIGGSVFQNVMKRRLVALHLDPDIARNAEAYIAVLHDTHPSPHRSAILNAYVHGFRGVFAVFCALAALALLVGLFIRHHDINKDLLTEHKLADGVVGWRRRENRSRSRSRSRSHNRGESQGQSRSQSRSESRNRSHNRRESQGQSQTQSQNDAKN